MDQIIKELVSEIENQATHLNMKKVPSISLEEIENLLNYFKKVN